MQVRTDRFARVTGDGWKTEYAMKRRSSESRIDRYELAAAFQEVSTIFGHALNLRSDSMC